MAEIGCHAFTPVFADMNVFMLLVPLEVAMEQIVILLTQGFVREAIHVLIIGAIQLTALVVVDLLTRHMVRTFLIQFHFIFYHVSLFTLGVSCTSGKYLCIFISQHRVTTNNK